MSEPIKLYDLDKRDYLNKRGDSFRSLQVSKCWVCGALSNYVIMGGYPGYGVRVICPNSSECWHHELEEKIEWLDNPHPKSYKDELQKEIDEMKKQHSEDIKNDLEGNPDMTLFRGVTNTFSYSKDKNPNCNHR
jgi:hypothetical protein